MSDQRSGLGWGQVLSGLTARSQGPAGLVAREWEAFFVQQVERWGAADASGPLGRAVALKPLVEGAVRGVLSTMRLPTDERVEQLEQRVAALEARLAALDPSPAKEAPPSR